MNDLNIHIFLILGIGGTILIPSTFIMMFVTNGRYQYRTRIKGSKKQLKKDIFLALGVLYAIIFILLFL